MQSYASQRFLQEPRVLLVPCKSETSARTPWCLFYFHTSYFDKLFSSAYTTHTLPTFAILSLTSESTPCTCFLVQLYFQTLTVCSIEQSQSRLEIGS